MNVKFYGRMATARELLSGVIPPPEEAQELYLALAAGASDNPPKYGFTSSSGEGEGDGGSGSTPTAAYFQHTMGSRTRGQAPPSDPGGPIPEYGEIPAVTATPSEGGGDGDAVFAHPFLDPNDAPPQRGRGLGQQPSDVFNDPVRPDELDEMATRHGV